MLAAKQIKSSCMLTVLDDGATRRFGEFHDRIEYSIFDAWTH